MFYDKESRMITFHNPVTPETGKFIPKFFCYTGENEKREKLMDMEPEVAKLSAQFGAAILKNTASVVNDKIKASKAKRNDKETISELTELITELLNEKQELQLIAQAFENQLVAQRLSDEDMQFIGNEIVPVLSILGESTMKTEEFEKVMSVIEPLLSPKTLRIMQIMGFNFKKAIGEPLTELSNDKIKNLSESENIDFKMAMAQRDVEYFKVLQDPDAFARMVEMKNA